MPVNVEVAEELGDLSYLYTRTRAGKELVVQRQGSRERLDGRSVSLSASPDHIMVFGSDGKGCDRREEAPFDAVADRPLNGVFPTNGRSERCD